MESTILIIWTIILIVSILVSFVGYYTGYYHVKMRVWAVVLFMALGTPLSVLLYMSGARKAKAERKTPPKSKIKIFFRSKIKNIFSGQFDLKKCAIITSVVCGIIVVLLLILIPVITDNQIKEAEKNSEYISVNGSAAFESGSINKHYTAYLIKGTAVDSSNKTQNYYFIIQFVGGQIRCYRTGQSNTYKASILNYFDNVCEEKPSPALVLGAGFIIDIILCVISIGVTAGLWSYWYYLNKKGKLNKKSKSKQVIVKDITITNGDYKHIEDVTDETKNKNDSVENRLFTLRNLYNKGLITEEEFKNHKSKILEDEFSDSSDDEVDDHLENDDEELENIGRVKIDPSAALMRGVPCLVQGQNLPKLSNSCEMRAPNESTESFCNRLHLRLIKNDGFGYSVDDPIGYYAVMGIIRADEYFKSIVPNTGENWKLTAFYRISSFKNCVDKYVVMYRGQVEGEDVGYAYELYLWMYDKNGFPENLMGIYRLPKGFIPNPNEYTWADKTLYNKKHNLYGKTPSERSEEEPKITLQESLHSRGRIGTIFMSELIDNPEEKNNILSEIPETEGFYDVTVKKEDMDKIKFGEYRTVNGKTFCPVAGHKIYLKDPASLQAIYEANNSEVLYVGKADNLRRRISQLVNMAFGGTSHRGGLDLWAIQDYEKYLQIEWSRLGDFCNSPEEAERNILNEFKKKHNGNLPVANRKGI